MAPRASEVDENRTFKADPGKTYPLGAPVDVALEKHVKATLRSALDEQVPYNTPTATTTTTTV